MPFKVLAPHPGARAVVAVVLLVIGLTAVGAAAADAPTFESAAYLKDLKHRMAACLSCHGEHGEGGKSGDTFVPRLAGQSTDYLLKQLRDFQKGKRHNDVMQRMVKNLPTPFLREMARYFSIQNAPYPPAGERLGGRTLDARQAQRARIIVTRGKPDSDLPACASCHGAGLAGTGQDHGLMAPALAGQYADYLAAQLQAWRSGSRTNDPVGVMAGVASRLTQKDVAALTGFLAGREPGTVKRAAVSYDEFQGRGPESGDKPDAEQQARIRRGEYLAKAGDCEACHTAEGGPPFAGGLPLETPHGVIYTPNITPDKATGIGNWSDEDFYKAVHDGIAPGHRYLYPAFPFPSFTRVSKADVLAIKAYLFSLKPVHRPRRENHMDWPYSIRAGLFAWRQLFFDAQTFKPRPDKSAIWNRGAYLVEGLGHCEACHTPRNALGAKKSSESFSGSLIHDWFAPNISGASYGIGRWSVNDLVQFLGTGEVPGKTVALGPMKEVIHDSLQHLSDADLKAMAVYLKSTAPRTPAESEKGKRTSPAQTVVWSAGQPIYQKQCASCHKADGRGEPPDFPPLHGNPVVSASNPTDVIRMILLGGFKVATKRTPRPHSMPPFAHRLSDKEIAEVASYIRSQWGGQYDKVDPARVERLR